jgi:MoaA/NifB/PqqE/SkfB family radical SAM enzyme
MVSNGRNLKKQSNGLAEALEKTWLDFIDVSIDSADSAVHDLIRGLPGSWQMTMEGVRWLTGQWNEYPLSIVSTLRRDNYQSILPLIDLCSSFCRSYQIQPIQPPPYVVTRPLSVPFVTAFFENLLKALDGPLAGRGLRVGFELYGYYLYAFLQAGLIQASAIREDDEGQLHIALQMNGNTVMVQLEILPLQAWRLDRILYDGSYLGHMHFLQAADPYSMSVGRIQDESIVSLYSKSIAYGSHFHQIVESRSQHECKSRSCWSGCFGGWNGAENAFVHKRPRVSLY